MLVVPEAFETFLDKAPLLLQQYRAELEEAQTMLSEANEQKTQWSQAASAGYVGHATTVEHLEPEAEAWEARVEDLTTRINHLQDYIDSLESLCEEHDVDPSLNLDDMEKSTLYNMGKAHFDWDWNETSKDDMVETLEEHPDIVAAEL